MNRGHASAGCGNGDVVVRGIGYRQWTVVGNGGSAS